MLSLFPQEFQKQLKQSTSRSYANRIHRFLDSEFITTTQNTMKKLEQYTTIWQSLMAEGFEGREELFNGGIFVNSDLTKYTKHKN